MVTNRHNWPFWLLIIVGLLLWLINWWAARPLFLDEANVARNVFDRSFLELLTPLDYQQYAPPLYLGLTKACGELFGYGERALRLPALLGGGLAVVSLALTGRELKLGYWGLLPLGLLFLNPTALRFVGELKPYALDLGVASLLLLLTFWWPRPNWRWALLGGVLIWLSLPAVFVLAAIPFALGYRSGRNTQLRWSLVVIGWLASFALLYWSVLQPSISKSLLTSFHTPYFFPLPQRDYFSFTQVFRLVQEQPRLAYGFTAFAILWGAGLAIFGAWRIRRKHLFLCLFPLLLVFAASALEKYSLIPRLMLFTLPGWWLLAAGGTKALADKWRTFTYSKYLIGLGWVVVLLGSNTLRHFVSPLNFSDARRLTTELESGYQTILHDSAVPGYDYYRRVHPQTANQATPRTASELEAQPREGKYVVLYDVLTSEKYRRELRQDSSWAVGQGATEVRIEPLYRSARLYVSFPAKDGL